MGASTKGSRHRDGKGSGQSERVKHAPTGKPTGTVKWFNKEKGYGFITPDAGEGDVFVHYSGIAGGGFRFLEEGERVEYKVVQGPKGPQAEGVVLIEG